MPHGRHAARSMRHRPWQQAWDNSLRDEIEDEQGWLLTFGDLMSLLLVMFVFIVAFASFEPERYAASQASQPAQTPTEPQTTPPPEPPPPPPSESAPEPELDPAFKTLGHDVQVSVEKGQINLQIPDNILFAPGAAELDGKGVPILDRIAELLKSSHYAISIEGHTDNLPIRTPRFPSNWELSASRAAAVLRYLIERGVEPTRMRAIGYADTRPIAANDTPESRAKNRRVTLVLHAPSAPDAPYNP
ncbi:MAG: OmpA/MotB family protein [Halothiobacillaceae bacterium]